MFETHQPIIGEYARASAANMARVYKFVLATIQQPLNMTPDIVADFEREGAASRYAFGVKADALRWIDDNAERVHGLAMLLWDSVADPDIAERELIGYFASLPGLGIVKGGFLAQLCFGVGGCLDMHNVARFGLNASRFNASRFKRAKTPRTRCAIVSEYCETLAACGGSALLWDEWCAYVAERDKAYTNAFAVSELHCTALGLAA